MRQSQRNDDITLYLENKEYIANRYLMKCFTVMMLVYLAAFILNIVGVFIIESTLIWRAFCSSLLIYISVFLIAKWVTYANKYLKYVMLFSIVLVFTITGVYITYHVALISLLPFLYATLYSSKSLTRFVFILNVISTFIVVYGGYQYGLCDANMVLLTTNRTQDYVRDNQFILTELNSNPGLNLFLFFVMPRCLIYIAFTTVCSSIFKMLSGSLEKAKLSAELEKAKLEAERANMAKTRFLNRMSHEIRTPINAVIGMNEMILRESTESNIKEYANDVKDSSVVLLNLVNEILDSSKIESGMMEIVPANYELGSILNDIYNMTGIKAREKNLKLVFDVDESIPGGYYGDDRRLRQILLNLLSNAVKYTQKGTVTLEVRCTVQGEEALLHFKVQDTGIGIKAEDLEKLSNEFQRLDVSKNRDVEGTGLGLSISKQLLLLMGSELHISSEYGKGSEFSFELSQRIVNAEPLKDFRNRLQHMEAGEEGRIDYLAPDARVLVVDDNHMNLKVFKNLLKRTRMNIFEADSGAACLELLRKNRYHIVFVDHMMPEMDGVETLRAMKEEKLGEGASLIMFTANAIVGEKQKYIREGFDNFLSKPIIPDELDKMILKYLPSELVIYEQRMNVTDSIKADDTAQKQGSSPDVSVLDTLKEELPELDIAKGLATSCGDKDFYLELLNDFTELPIKNELNTYLRENNFKNYCIRIHAFKNSAYSVGAQALGDLAYQMECLTRQELPKQIEELQKELFAGFDRICEKYKGEKGEK